MEAGHGISAEAEIGLKTAGGARDTDSDTNWMGKRSRMERKKESGRIPDRRG